MALSPETVKVIMLIIGAVISIAVCVATYYLISFIKQNKKDKRMNDQRIARYHHRHDAMYFAMSTYKNGFDPAKFDPVYRRKLQELLDDDDLFKD